MSQRGLCPLADKEEEYHLRKINLSLPIMNGVLVEFKTSYLSTNLIINS